MQLKDHLRELRKSNKLTLRNLAEATGLSVSYMSDIERGRTSPSLKTLEALAEALGVSVTVLLTGVETVNTVDVSNLPLGLSELTSDPDFKDEINDDWLDLLSKIQMRGKRPETKREWMELYLHLKRVLET